MLSLLPGVQWDLTWNHWKHWLATRLEVHPTFVYAAKYRLKKGECILRTWHAALPPRFRVMVPADLAAGIERAKALIEVSAIAWSDGWCMSDDQDAEPVSVAPGSLDTRPRTT